MRKLALLIFLVFCCVGKSKAGDRWNDYIQNDLHRITSGLDFSSLLITGGWLGSMYLLSDFDEKLNNSVKVVYKGKLKPYFKTVDYLGFFPLSVPISFGVAGMTLLGENKKLQDAAFTSFEAAVLSGLIVSMGKVIIGRSRPDDNQGSRHFDPFSGFDESFPSGHAATAFALITPWVVYYPSIYTYTLLILPVSTAVARMIFNKHWATDVLTGSVLGFFIAYNLANWHKERAEAKNYYRTNNQSALSLTLKIPL
jgi:membrane-associated phospholipid phosphatase